MSSFRRRPQGTGLGHGIGFFLDPDEAIDANILKIDHCIKETEAYYGAVVGASPSTPCEFADTCTLPRAGHPPFGYKYEARVVFYGDRMSLKAVPGITKISRQDYDADKLGWLGLVNNVAASAETKKRARTDFMLPL